MTNYEDRIQKLYDDAQEHSEQMAAMRAELNEKKIYYNDSQRKQRKLLIYILSAFSAGCVYILFLHGKFNHPATYLLIIQSIMCAIFGYLT